MLHPVRQRAGRGVRHRRAPHVAEHDDVVRIERGRGVGQPGGRPHRHLESGCRERGRQVARAGGRPFDIEHADARPGPGGAAHGVVRRQRIAWAGDDRLEDEGTRRLQGDIERHGGGAGGDRDRTLCDDYAIGLQRDGGGPLALAADANRDGKRAAGADPFRHLDGLDPGVAERSHGERFDGHGHPGRAEPRDRRRHVARGRPAVAEQHQPRDVARRQFAARRVERDLEIRPAPAETIRVRGCRIDPRQRAQRARVLHRPGARAEHDDARVRRTERRVEFVDPPGRSVNRRTADTVRDVHGIHDGLARRGRRHDRARQRQRERREDERSQRRLHAPLPGIEIGARREVGEPHEWHRREEPERRRSCPGHAHVRP